MPRRTLLLIDDEDDIREIAAMTLQTMGDFDIIAARDGASGIAKAAQARPDAILLDFMMPGLDGPATFERLQESESTRAIPVIFMTAKVQAADRRRLVDLGARGVISKPFDPMTLAEEVSGLLSA